MRRWGYNILQNNNLLKKATPVENKIRLPRFRDTRSNSAVTVFLTPVLIPLSDFSDERGQELSDRPRIPIIIGCRADQAACDRRTESGHPLV